MQIALFEALGAEPPVFGHHNLLTTASGEGLSKRTGALSIESLREDGIEPLPAGMQSAGGMPERVKCLHALVAHELAVPGANPFGREALAALPEWWRSGPCVCTDPAAQDAPDAEEAK